MDASACGIRSHHLARVDHFSIVHFDSDHVILGEGFEEILVAPSVRGLMSKVFEKLPSSTMVRSESEFELICVEILDELHGAGWEPESIQAVQEVLDAVFGFGAQFYGWPAIIE